MKKKTNKPKSKDLKDSLICDKPQFNLIKSEIIEKSDSESDLYDSNGMLKSVRDIINNNGNLGLFGIING